MHNDSQSDRFTTQIKGKAGRLEPLFVAAWIGVAMFSAPLPGQELALERLATRCDYTAGRITAHDPKGSNQDFWVIAPGETRVLAEITGPGSIVHFRDNIFVKYSNMCRQTRMKVSGFFPPHQNQSPLTS